MLHRARLMNSVCGARLSDKSYGVPSNSSRKGLNDYRLIINMRFFSLILLSLPITTAAIESKGDRKSCGIVCFEILVTDFHEPVVPFAFDPLPLGSIGPNGWLRTELEASAAGLGG